MPLNLLAEIVRFSDPVDWAGYWFFRQVLRARSKEIVAADQVRHAYTGPLFDGRYIPPASAHFNPWKIRSVSIRRRSARFWNTAVLFPDISLSLNTARSRLPC